MSGDVKERRVVDVELIGAQVVGLQGACTFARKVPATFSGKVPATATMAGQESREYIALELAAVSWYASRGDLVRVANNMIPADSMRFHP